MANTPQILDMVKAWAADCWYMWANISNSDDIQPIHTLTDWLLLTLPLGVDPWHQISIHDWMWLYVCDFPITLHCFSWSFSFPGKPLAQPEVSQVSSIVHMVSRKWDSWATILSGYARAMNNEQRTMSVLMMNKGLLLQLNRGHGCWLKERRGRERGWGGERESYAQSILILMYFINLIHVSLTVRTLKFPRSCAPVWWTWPAQWSVHTSWLGTR